MVLGGFNGVSWDFKGDAMGMGKVISSPCSVIYIFSAFQSHIIKSILV